MRNLMRKAILALAVVGGASALAATPALAASTPSASTQKDGNWSGYFATSPSNSPVVWAAGNITVPTVYCNQSRGTEPYYAVLWIGIGGAGKGDGDNGAEPLEQDGIIVSCDNANRNTAAVYEPFWQVPNVTGVNWQYHTWKGAAAKVTANDTIQASVTAPQVLGSGGKWSFQVTDIDKGTMKSWSASIKLPAYVYGIHADAILEAPTQGSSQSNYGFPYMGSGTVHFTAVSYENLRGEELPISGTADDLVHPYPTGPVATCPGPTSQSGKTDSFNIYYGPNWWGVTGQGKSRC